MLGEVERPHAERRVLVAADQPALAARDRDDRRQVPGVGEPQAPVGRVEDGVDAGDDLVLAEVADQAVERLQQVGRRQVEPGVGPHRRPQLAHHGGRPHAAAHHVADDQRGPAAAELDHVVPVAADLGALDAGAVVGRDLEVVEVEARLRQQAALQLVGDRVLAGGRLGVGGGQRQRLLGRAALGDVLHRPAQHLPLAVARRAPPRRRPRPGSLAVAADHPDLVVEAGASPSARSLHDACWSSGWTTSVARSRASPAPSSSSRLRPIDPEVLVGDLDLPGGQVDLPAADPRQPLRLGRAGSGCAPAGDGYDGRGRARGWRAPAPAARGP